MSEKVRTDVSYLNLSRNLSVVVVVNKHVSLGCLVGPQPGTRGC